jgi:hypothetical protein
MPDPVLLIDAQTTPKNNRFLALPGTDLGALSAVTLREFFQRSRCGDDSERAKVLSTLLKRPGPDHDDGWIGQAVQAHQQQLSGSGRPALNKALLLDVKRLGEKEREAVESRLASILDALPDIINEVHPEDLQRNLLVPTPVLERWYDPSWKSLGWSQETWSNSVVAGLHPRKNGVTVLTHGLAFAAGAVFAICIGWTSAQRRDVAPTEGGPVPSGRSAEVHTNKPGQPHGVLTEYPSASDTPKPDRFAPLPKTVLAQRPEPSPQPPDPSGMPKATPGEGAAKAGGQPGVHPGTPSPAPDQNNNPEVRKHTRTDPPLQAGGSTLPITATPGSPPPGAGAAEIPPRPAAGAVGLAEPDQRVPSAKDYASEFLERYNQKTISDTFASLDKHINNFTNPFQKDVREELAFLIDERSFRPLKEQWRAAVKQWETLPTPKASTKDFTKKQPAEKDVQALYDLADTYLRVRDEIQKNCRTFGISEDKRRTETEKLRKELEPGSTKTMRLIIFGDQDLLDHFENVYLTWGSRKVPCNPPGTNEAISNSRSFEAKLSTRMLYSAWPSSMTLWLSPEVPIDMDQTFGLGSVGNAVWEARKDDKEYRGGRGQTDTGRQIRAKEASKDHKEDRRRGLSASARLSPISLPPPPEEEPR